MSKRLLCKLINIYLHTWSKTICKCTSITVHAKPRLSQVIVRQNLSVTGQCQAKLVCRRSMSGKTCLRLVENLGLPVTITGIRKCWKIMSISDTPDSENSDGFLLLCRPGLFFSQSILVCDIYFSIYFLWKNQVTVAYIIYFECLQTMYRKCLQTAHRHCLQTAYRIRTLY